MLRSVITGTGCYIPPVIKKNSDFVSGIFYDEHHQPLSLSSEVIVKKFGQITGIEERRYAPDNLNTSDLAAKAAMLVGTGTIGVKRLGHFKSLNGGRRNGAESAGRNIAMAPPNAKRRGCKRPRAWDA